MNVGLNNILFATARGCIDTIQLSFVSARCFWVCCPFCVCSTIPISGRFYLGWGGLLCCVHLRVGGGLWDWPSKPFPLTSFKSFFNLVHYKVSQDSRVIQVRILLNGLVIGIQFTFMRSPFISFHLSDSLFMKLFSIGCFLAGCCFLGCCY